MAQQFTEKDVSNYAKQITHLKHELQKQQQQNADFIVQLNHRVEQLANRDSELISLRGEITKCQGDGASKLLILDKQLQYIQSLEMQVQNQQSLQLLAQQQSTKIEELSRMNLSQSSELQTKDQLVQELTKQLKLLIVENTELNERMPQPFQQASELAAELEGQMANIIQGFNSLEQPVDNIVSSVQNVNIQNIQYQERLDNIKNSLRNLDFSGLRRNIQSLQVTKLQNPDFSEITKQVSKLALLNVKNQSIIDLQAQDLANSALTIDNIKTESQNKYLEFVELKQQLDLQLQYNLDLKSENAHLCGQNQQKLKILKQQTDKIANLEQLYNHLESQFKQRYKEAEERNCEILQNLLLAKQQAIEYEQSLEHQEDLIQQLQTDAIQQFHLYKKDVNDQKISVSGIKNAVTTCMQDLKYQVVEERRNNQDNFILFQQLQSSIDEQLQLTSSIQTSQHELMQIDETKFDQPKSDFGSQTISIEYVSVLIQTDENESIIQQLQNEVNTSAQNVRMLQNQLTQYQELIQSLQHSSLNEQDKQSKTHHFQMNQLESDKQILQRNMNTISNKNLQLTQEIKLQNNYIIEQTKIIQKLKYQETQYHQLQLEFKTFKKLQDKKQQEFTISSKDKENQLKEQKDKFLQLLVSKQEVDQQVLKLKHIINELKSENQLLSNQVNQKSLQLNDIKLTQSLLQQQNMLLQSKQMPCGNSAQQNSAIIVPDEDELENSSNSLDFSNENVIQLSKQDQYKIKQLNNQIVELKNQLKSKNQIIKDKEIEYLKIATVLDSKNQRSVKVNRNLISLEYDKTLKQKQSHLMLSIDDYPYLDQKQQQANKPPMIPTTIDNQVLKTEFSVAKQKDQEYKELLTQMKSTALEQDQLKMNANQIKMHQYKIQKQDTNKSLSKKSSVSSLFDTND